MKFSHDFLQSFFSEKLPPAKELGDLLMMHFFEVEGIEKNGSDYVLDIDILPSRGGDCLSHLGVAREISAITGLKMKFPETKVKEDKEELADRTSVDVKGACFRYTLRGVKNIKVKNSPAFIQKRLKSCGIKPINNVVDITNYVMLETGQPLHAFDVKKLEGENILVRFAKNREKIVTLDEKRYELDPSVLVIADELSPIGIAGIKGGIVPEVDKDTEMIYLEAANFDPLVVRRGSQMLKLRTDASLRFEHGISPEFTKIAVDRAAFLLSKYAGGKVLKGEIDFYPEKQKTKSIEFEAEDVCSVLGVDVPVTHIEKILKALEFKAQRSDGSFYVEVPYFRKDIEIKEDVVEEIGRIYGYDKVEPELPKESIVPPQEEDFTVFEDVCRRFFQGIGFNENYGYSFINEKKAYFFDTNSLIEMEKPVSLEFKYLRPTALLNLLDTVENNKNNFSEIEVFEVGKVFKKEEGTEEKKKLTAVSLKDNFFEMKGKINVFLENIFADEVSYEKVEEDNIFDEKRSAKIFYKKEEIGMFGFLKKEVLKKMKASVDPVFAEIDMEKAESFYKETKEYEKISRYPSLIRDVAVLVPKETPFGDVLKKTQEAGGKILREVSLFDFYEGKEIPENMKSFALRMVFQAQGKTISPEEANKLQKKVISTLESVQGWKVRK